LRPVGHDDCARDVHAAAPACESVDDRGSCPVDARGDVARIRQPSAQVLERGNVRVGASDQVRVVPPDGHERAEAATWAARSEALSILPTAFLAMTSTTKIDVGRLYRLRLRAQRTSSAAGSTVRPGRGWT